MRTRLVGFTLFFIILTPLFISLFLHNFGNNRFDIPIYHEKYIPDEFSFCSIKITSPYKKIKSIIAKSYPIASIDSVKKILNLSLRLQLSWLLAFYLIMKLINL